jgi:hypothetical protein
MNLCFYLLVFPLVLLVLLVVSQAPPGFGMA